MKFWVHQAEKTCSIFCQPLDWNGIVSLFDGYATCNVELFDGFDVGKSYYKTSYAYSPELSALNNQLELEELDRTVKVLSMTLHEFRLRIGDAIVEKTIDGGVLFTSGQSLIKGLISKLKIPIEMQHPKFHRSLVSYSGTRLNRIEGVFTNANDILDHLYDDFMEEISPGYTDFMVALDQAPLANP